MNFGLNATTPVALIPNKVFSTEKELKYKTEARNTMNSVKSSYNGSESIYST